MYHLSNACGGSWGGVHCTHVRSRTTVMSPVPILHSYSIVFKWTPLRKVGARRDRTAVLPISRALGCANEMVCIGPIG